MASTEIQVCNQALALLNLNPITAYADNRLEAQRLGILFADSRDEVLREHAWGFATRIEELVTTEDAGLPDRIDDYAGNYLFVYVIPEQCVRILKLPNPNRPDECLPYQIVYNPTVAVGPPVVAAKRILAYHEDATIEYVYRVTDVSFWDAHFVRTMAAYLAWKLTPLRGKEEIRRWAFNTYQMALQAARIADATEHSRDVDTRPCRYKDARR